MCNGTPPPPHGFGRLVVEGHLKQIDSFFYKKPVYMSKIGRKIRNSGLRHTHTQREKLITATLCKPFNQKIGYKYKNKTMLFAQGNYLTPNKNPRDP